MRGCRTGEEKGGRYRGGDLRVAGSEARGRNGGWMYGGKPCTVLMPSRRVTYLFI